MSRTFELTELFDAPTDAVLAALTDEKLWATRAAEASERATVEYDTLADGTVQIAVTEDVGAAVLPGIIQKVIRGDLKIHRTDRWQPLVGDTAHGTLSGHSTGLPAKVEATFTLAPTETGSALTLVGQADVKIPLVGGKIESMVTDMVGKILHGEAKQTRKALTGAE